MYDKFSSQAKQIIVRSHKYALNDFEYIVGTEHLLLSLYNEPNSSCQILLSEYDITEADILNTINSLDLFRKNIPGLVIYTPKFRAILDKSIEVAKLTNSNSVYEEHLFYALLNINECIANTVLNEFDIDIEDLIDEILKVMDWKIDIREEKKNNLTNFSFVENITQLVIHNKLMPLIGRIDIIERINNILNKKNKRNVILIGNAGVGKSAIVEGLAQKYYNNNVNREIISLNITSLLAGTKYRGDFEQRIKNFLDVIKNDDSIILFIDEIHNIINVGNGDSNLDVANILKPALARGEINCIGATTIDEYYKHIANDTALSRRFLPIFVNEPTLEETINILTNIKKYFHNYHQVDIPDFLIPYLCERVERTIVNRHFPDKAIDVLDEACSYAKMHNISTLDYKIIDSTIQLINNQHISNSSISKLNKYPFLKRYYLRHFTNIKSSYQPIISLLIKYKDDDQLNNFLEDLALVFNIRGEAIKKLNMSNFQEDYSISNLIGSPPGYVGFNNPNTLTKFVQKYPRCILLFKNIDQSANNINQLIKDMLTSGYIEDLASNKVFFTNTIIVGTENNKLSEIGFLNNNIKNVVKKSSFNFDEKINLNEYIYKTNTQSTIEEIIKKYLHYFKINDIQIEIDENLYGITEDDYQKFENILFDCMFNCSDSKPISIGYDTTTKSFVIKK